jgi:hypothetical protein
MDPKPYQPNDAQTWALAAFLCLLATVITWDSCDARAKAKEERMRYLDETKRLQAEQDKIFIQAKIDALRAAGIDRLKFEEILAKEKARKAKAKEKSR